MVAKNQKRITKIVAIAVIFIAIVIGLYLIFTANNTRSSNKTPQNESSITVEGKLVCLPHKDTAGPQTQECAYGLQANDGKYYAVRDNSNDFSLISQTGAGKKVKITGTFHENPATKYQDVGTITVNNFEVLD